MTKQRQTSDAETTGERTVVTGTHIYLTKKGRCCTTLIAADSHRESIWLDGLYEQVIPRPLPHHELVQLHRLTEEAWVFADLAGQGDDLGRAA